MKLSSSILRLVGVVNCWTEVNVKKEERITTKKEEEDGDEDMSQKKSGSWYHANKEKNWVENMERKE